MFFWNQTDSDKQKRQQGSEFLWQKTNRREMRPFCLSSGGNKLKRAERLNVQVFRMNPGETLNPKKTSEIKTKLWGNKYG